MMKKIYLFIIALGLIAGSVNAQNDPNAKKVLDAVSAKLKTYKGITGSFNLVSKTRTGKVNKNVPGKISIKGNKYYIKQGGTEIFSDGNKTWNYNGNDEVTVNTADADDQALTPQKLLTNFYDKDFSYKLVSSAGNYNEIQMVPNDKRKNFKQVNVFIDKSRMMITRARVLDKSNNTLEFNLSNINTAANIPDNTFVFNKNKYKKNIEVIE
jgi:outer membrane lipoprotein-sorting protein